MDADHVIDLSDDFTDAFDDVELVVDVTDLDGRHHAEQAFRHALAARRHNAAADAKILRLRAELDRIVG